MAQITGKLTARYYPYVLCFVLVLHVQQRPVKGQNNRNEKHHPVSVQTIHTESEVEKAVEHQLSFREKTDRLKHDLIAYGNRQLPTNLHSVYNQVINKAFENLAVLSLMGLTLAFIFSIILILLILRYSNKKKNYTERYELLYKKMYEDAVLEHILGLIDWPVFITKLKLHKMRKNRKILIAVLMHFKANFKGEFERVVPEIYLKLNLQKDSLKLARSYRNYKKVKGIAELTDLYPEGAKEIITKLINHKNDAVRAEAQIAYVRLHPENPFHFFNQLEKPFVKWSQLSAFHIIRHNQIPAPSFSKFLANDHFNIRNFSLMMITFFQQLENIDEIIKLLDCTDAETRFLVYKAICELRVYSSRDLIKSRYDQETAKNKHEIVRAFQNIGDENDFDFLENIMKNESVSLKLEACRSLHAMSLAGQTRITTLKNNQIPQIELLLAHVTDPRN